MLKKLFVMIFVISLLSTDVSFALQPSSTQKYINNLSKVSDDLNLSYSQLINNAPYDKKEMQKHLNFNRVILNETVTDVKRDYDQAKDSSSRRKYASIATASSLYALAINGVLLYLEDNDNLPILLSSISEAKQANDILHELKKSNK